MEEDVGFWGENYPEANRGVQKLVSGSFGSRNFNLDSNVLTRPGQYCQGQCSVG